VTAVIWEWFLNATSRVRSNNAFSVSLSKNRIFTTVNFTAVNFTTVKKKTEYANDSEKKETYIAAKASLSIPFKIGNG